MRAVVYEKYGPPEVLQLRDVPKPVPNDDEVLIKVHAATVVPGDCEMRSFKFPLWFWLPLRLYVGLLRPKRVPILGQELAGEIAAIGANVTRFKVEDQVCAATEAKFGAYCEYRCVRESGPISIKPAGVSWEEAAAVPTGGLNALHYVRLCEIQPGQKILINGACGNIGTFAVQIAKHFRAEVTAVDSAAKLDTLRSIGADHVIDYIKDDFTANGVTYDAILDVVGKAPYARSLASLASNGRFVIANPRVYGMVRGLWTNATGAKKVRYRFCDYQSADLDTLRELIESDALKVVIDRSWPMDQIQEAHRYVDSKQQQGTVAISVATTS